MKALNFSYPVYNLILHLKLAEVIIKEFVKFFLLSDNPQKRRYFLERLGVIERMDKALFKDCVWFHANSIGEVKTIKPLVDILREKTALKAIISTGNFSADSEARKIFSDSLIFFMPYDTPLIFRKVLKFIKPKLFIIVECDIWPNYIRHLEKRNIPLVMVNFRFKPLRVIYNFSFRLTIDVFRKIDLFLVRRDEDRRVLLEYRLDDEKIIVAGDLKFYSTVISKNETPFYRELFGLRKTDVCIVAGCLHEKEDELIIDIFSRIMQKINDIFLVIAPRYLGLIKDVEQHLKRRGFEYAFRTQLNGKSNKHPRIIIVDTKGELADIYSAADISFVGGSMFFYGNDVKGHNIIEPAVYNIPVLFGENIGHFKTASDILIKMGIGVKVKDKTELEDNIVKFAENSSLRTEFKAKSRTFFNNTHNVALKIFKEISRYIQ